MKKEMEFQLNDKGSAKKVKNYKLMFFCLQKITSQQLNIFSFKKTADRRMLFFILKILFSVGRCQQPEMKLLFFFLFFLH